MQGQRQFTAGSVEELVRQLNVVWGLFQQGGLMLGGLKLETRDAVPTGAPGKQDPNLVRVDVGGVLTLYHWDGTNWVVI